MAHECQQRRAEEHLNNRNGATLLVMQQGTRFGAEYHEATTSSNSETGLVLIQTQKSDI
jgi:hypothetical protein